jgi:hypothetical protein
MDNSVNFTSMVFSALPSWRNCVLVTKRASTIGAARLPSGTATPAHAHTSKPALGTLSRASGFDGTKVIRPQPHPNAMPIRSLARRNTHQ